MTKGDGTKYLQTDSRHLVKRTDNHWEIRASFSKSPFPLRALRLLLYDSRPRAYTLRILLLSSSIGIGLLRFAIHIYYYLKVWNYYIGTSPIMGSYICGIIGYGLLILHHISFPLLSAKKKINFLISVLDLGLILIEIALTSLPLAIYFTSTGTDRSPDPNAWIYVNEMNLGSITINPHMFFQVFGAITVSALGLSLIFRISTLAKKCELGFLGGCTAVNPAYTPGAILLNRSLLRPLVRHSIWIILLRALMLSCLGIIFPAFAIYFVFLQPAQSAVYLKRYVTGNELGSYESPPRGHVSFYVVRQHMSSSGFQLLNIASIQSTTMKNRFSPESIVINVTATLGFHSTQASVCPIGEVQGYVDHWFEFNGPFEWRELNIFIQFSFVFSPHQGRDVTIDDDGGLIFHNRKILPTLLLVKSHQFSMMSWTVTRVTSELIYLPQITNVQQDTALQIPDSTPNLATFRIATLNSSISDYSEEVSDASVLSGFSNVGGFWTFMNGTFALFFGANIMYFAFARRPLSALGIAHVFQSSALIRRWHEAFSALRTEGGLPGSESAGIVLIRFASSKVPQKEHAYRFKEALLVAPRNSRTVCAVEIQWSLVTRTDLAGPRILLLISDK
ncbi:hypothetical protein C8J57DRAFT_1645492 [Mycena rebaudengoi]|nr:hypothetical protein C8J57DRAFT_1645492 [Mycena rebaudengoi]